MTCRNLCKNGTIQSFDTYHWCMRKLSCCTKCNRAFRTCEKLCPCCLQTLRRTSKGRARKLYEKEYKRY